MTLATRASFGMSKQRGIWLRCFLGFGLIPACVFALAAQSAPSQFKYLKPLHLSRAYGYVLSETGKPLAGVQVVLASGGPPSLAMNTDANGYFEFPEAKGEYSLHVKIPGLALMDRQVIVGADPRGQPYRGPLYVMMKSGACGDCTSEVFTSKKQFDRAVRDNTVNHD
jgi:hypothetical protein